MYTTKLDTLEVGTKQLTPLIYEMMLIEFIIIIVFYTLS